MADTTPPFTPLAGRLTNLPIILAGPILRRTTPEEVNVWVALRVSATIELRILDSDDQGQIMFSGSAATMALGQHLHLACVTATKTGGLQAGNIYFYELFINGKSFTAEGVALNANPNFPSLFQAEFYKNFCLGDYQLPSFCLPPAQGLMPVIAHGSCRKIHCSGKDAMIKLDTVLRQHHNKPLERPQLLCLTGDQIYADDVDKGLLHILMDAAQILLPNCKEDLPDELPSPTNEAKPTPAPTGQFYSRDRAPGKRDTIIRTIGFTAGDKECKNHLLTLGEFCMMYLFAWSPTLWPSGGLGEAAGSVIAFRNSLLATRRALANIPSYMIFDDHDITDDWFFDYNWCKQNLTNNTSRRVIANGLAAFTWFQMWGNIGKNFFQSGFFNGFTQFFSANDAPDWTLIENRLLPTLEKHGEPEQYWLNYPINSVKSPWCFQLDFQGFRIIFLDTRTQRGFATKTARPALIHKDKINGQLNVSGTKPLTIVVSPAPVFETEFKEFGQDVMALIGITLPKTSMKQIREAIKKGRIEYDYETWQGDPTAFSQLLLSLAAFKKVAILSGDVHYAFSLRITFQALNGQQATMLQLCSSAFKNALLFGGFKEKYVVAKLYAILDSGHDNFFLAAKFENGTTNLKLIKEDQKITEPGVIWQYKHEPIRDIRTAKIRGRPPVTSGAKSYSDLGKIHQNYIEWEDEEYLVLNNNFATLTFGAQTLTHNLQYTPDLKDADLTWTENLTQHILDLDFTSF